MLEFLKVNIVTIVAVVVILISLVMIYKHRNNVRVLNVILSSVILAEKKLGSGTGELKYALVVDNIYKRLPKILLMTFSEKEIDDMIEYCVQRLKEILEDGVNLSSYDDEVYISKLI